MSLPSREMELLRSLEKNVAEFRRLRWVFIALGTLLICMSPGLTLLYFSTGHPTWISGFENEPMFYLIAVAGGAAIGYGMQGFKGDPIKELVIYLVRRVDSDS